MRNRLFEKKNVTEKLTIKNTFIAQYRPLD